MFVGCEELVDCVVSVAAAFFEGADDGDAVDGEGEGVLDVSDLPFHDFGSGVL